MNYYSGKNEFKKPASKKLKSKLPYKKSKIKLKSIKDTSIGLSLCLEATNKSKPIKRN